MICERKDKHTLKLLNFSPIGEIASWAFSKIIPPVSRLVFWRVLSVDPLKECAETQAKYSRSGEWSLYSMVS